MEEESFSVLEKVALWTVGVALLFAYLFVSQWAG